eukprot:gene4866-6065_t
MVSEKRKLSKPLSSKNDISVQKKNKLEESSIMAMGMDYDDEGDNIIDDDGDDTIENAVKFDPRFYKKGRPTILPEKSDATNPKYINLKVKNLKESELSVAPTNEEIQSFKETQDLFNSNLFRLQVTELFNQVKVDYTKTSALDSALHQIKSIIEIIPDQVVDVKKDKIKGVKLFSDTKNEINFSKPSNIEVVGSFMSRTVVKTIRPNVDICLEMPDSVFEKQDANNFNYFSKRNIYIWKIAQELKKHPRFTNVSFTNLNGDSNKQILIVRPKEDPVTKAHTKFSIRIIPSINKNLFKIYNKFDPDMACIFQSENEDTRIETFKEVDEPDSEDEKKIVKKGNTKKRVLKKAFHKVRRTPYYNNAILEDIFFYDHFSIVHDTISHAPVLGDAIILLKIWLELKNIASFNNFHLTMLVTYLYSIGRVTKSMSCYQVFRMTLVFITREFINKPIFMKLDQDASQSIQHRQFERSFQRIYPCVFIDGSGLLNIASRITVWGLKQLKHVAETTLKLLDSGDGFEEIFMTKSHFHLEYDYILNIKLSKENDNTIPLNDYYLVEKYLDHKIFKLLKKALTKRIKAIHLIQFPDLIWEKDLPNMEERNVVVGLNVNAGDWIGLADLGPPADHPSAKEFRQFWGPKSQLRRFKDGSILEACAWAPLNGQRHLVIEEIVKYILGYRIKLPTNKVSSTIAKFDPLLHQGLEDHTISALKAKEDVITTIRSLNLPLTIENFPSMCPGLRYTSVSTTYDPSYLHNTPMEILLHFEQSRQWTSDLDSIHALKTAFLLKIARELEGTDFNPKLTEEYLDIQCQGFVFRLISYYPKELEFMRDQWKLERLPAIESLQHNSLHHTYIQSLHTAFPSYGHTTRLALRWIHSHHFTGYIDQNTVELMVASLYRPSVSPVPETPVSGFLRFLFLLYTHNWSEKALIVDYQDIFTREDILQIQTIYDNQKKNLPVPPIIFIATEKDKASLWWKKSTITNPLILQRMISYARKSLEIIESNYLNDLTGKSTGLNWLSIFEPSYIEYDAIFNLYEKYIPNNYREITNVIQNKICMPPTTVNKPSVVVTQPVKTPSPTSKTSALSLFKNIKPSTIITTTETNNNNNNNNHNNSTLICGFNPVHSLISKLNERFSDYCLFFYDEVGGSKISLKWKPSAFLPTPFKPSKSKYVVPLTVI